MCVSCLHNLCVVIAYFFTPIPLRFLGSVPGEIETLSAPHIRLPVDIQVQAEDGVHFPALPHLFLRRWPQQVFPVFWLPFRVPHYHLPKWLPGFSIFVFSFDPTACLLALAPPALTIYGVTHAGSLSLARSTVSSVFCSRYFPPSAAVQVLSVLTISASFFVPPVFYL